MILGVGVDIIYIARIEEAIKREGFLNKIFSLREQERIARRKNLPQSIAGAFAAKEAVSKALGTGIGKISWQNIEILNDDACRPVCHLNGGAYEKMLEMGGRGLHISISHEKDIAIAQAILEG